MATAKNNPLRATRIDSAIIYLLVISLVVGAVWVVMNTSNDKTTLTQPTAPTAEQSTID